MSELIFCFLMTSTALMLAEFVMRCAPARVATHIIGRLHFLFWISMCCTYALLLVAAVGSYLLGYRW